MSKFISSFLLLCCLSLNVYAGCQWESQADLEQDIDRASELLRLRMICSNYCDLIETEYEALAKKTEYFDPCGEDILTDKHIKQIISLRNNFDATKSRKVEAGNDGADTGFPETPSSQEEGETSSNTTSAQRSDDSGDSVSQDQGAGNPDASTRNQTNNNGTSTRQPDNNRGDSTSTHANQNPEQQPSRPTNEWPNSNEKKVSDSCVMKVYDNIPSGCWCSGSSAKAVSNTERSNGSSGGDEDDGIRIQLSDPISPDSSEKDCAFAGFTDKNTFFGTMTSTCIDPECGTPSYSKQRVYVYSGVKEGVPEGEKKAGNEKQATPFVDTSGEQKDLEELDQKVRDIFASLKEVVDKLQKLSELRTKAGEFICKIRGDSGSCKQIKKMLTETDKAIDTLKSEINEITDNLNRVNPI